MLYQLLSYVADRVSGKPTHQRSGHWPIVEKEHLEKEPVCQVCGGKEQLNVHHKKPFHLFHDLELDPKNLITLCNANRCHILFGHGGDFHAYNPHVDADVFRAREMIRSRKYEP